MKSHEFNKIRAMRKGYGFTQKYMAENLGISVSTYQNKEQGRVRFSDREKVSMAHILQLSADQVNDIFLTESHQSVNKIDEWFVCESIIRHLGVIKNGA